MPALISMKGTRRYTVQSPTTEDNDSSDLDVVTPAPFSGNVHETRRRHNIPLDTIDLLNVPNRGFRLHRVSLVPFPRNILAHRKISGKGPWEIFMKAKVLPTVCRAA